MDSALERRNFQEITDSFQNSPNSSKKSSFIETDVGKEIENEIVTDFFKQKQ